MQRTAVVSGVRQTVEQLEAPGLRGDTADPEVEGMMPFLDVALDHMRCALTSMWQTSRALTPEAGLCTTSTSTTAAAAGCSSAG